MILGDQCLLTDLFSRKNKLSITFTAGGSLMIWSKVFTEVKVLSSHRNWDRGGTTFLDDYISIASGRGLLGPCEGQSWDRKPT